jgi:hypothetical protein
MSLIVGAFKLGPLYLIGFISKSPKKYYFISNVAKIANLPGGHLSLTKHKI